MTSADPREMREKGELRPPDAKGEKLEGGTVARDGKTALRRWILCIGVNGKYEVRERPEGNIL